MGRRTYREIEQLLQAELKCARNERRCLTASDCLSGRLLKSLAKKGKLLMPAPGCYEAPEAWPDLGAVEQSLRIMRAHQLRDKSLVFCGPSAALAWGLYEPNHCIVRPHVITAQRSPSHSSSRLVRMCVPQNTDIDYYLGIQLTSLNRSAFDASRMLGFRRGLGICDRTLALCGITSRQLLTTFDEFCPSWKCEISRSCARWANPLSENGGESYARAAMIESGFAEPILQAVIRDPLERQKTYRTDYLWIPNGLDTQRVLKGLAQGTLGPGEASGCIAGELDGRAKTFDARMTHGRSAQDQLLAERRREARLTSYGIRVVRFSFREASGPGFPRLLESYGVPRLRRS